MVYLPGGAIDANKQNVQLFNFILLKILLVVNTLSTAKTAAGPCALIAKI